MSHPALHTHLLGIEDMVSARTDQPSRATTRPERVERHPQLQPTCKPRRSAGQTHSAAPRLSAPTRKPHRSTPTRKLHRSAPTRQPCCSAPTCQPRRSTPRLASRATPCSRARSNPPAAPTPFFASRLPAEPRPPSAASRVDTCPQAEPIPAFPVEPLSPFEPPSFFGPFPTCHWASLLGKRILLLLKFDRANLLPIRVVPAWVSFGITTNLGLRSPTGRQSRMDIDMIRVIRRDPRSPNILVFPPSLLQTSMS
ncbi:hypothetical protein E5676_scaffold165G00270 [Cucumis melo var. makuwa]|uniref:Uncharacterized protein n=1 Tax=Cucumis melo var. makuwa TaxID=1194695 RepID=A0A5D3DYK0_CUCMM|nr:hypothetical protein E5676_scaffold165G00270 [Cucumis melo var. makuwa]